jgi:hypothetical protein
MANRIFLKWINSNRLHGKSRLKVEKVERIVRHFGAPTFGDIMQRPGMRQLAQVLWVWVWVVVLIFCAVNL